MAIDVSLRSTGITPEPVRESAVDRSGALLGQGMAAASGVAARSAYNQVQAAENFAQIAPSVVNTLQNAQQGFFQAELDKELNQQTQDFITGKSQSPEELRMGVGIAGKLKELKSSIFGTPTRLVENTVNAFDKETEKLISAHEQGMMQPSELVSRLKSTIRKHVAQNPGMADQLYNHGMRTLQLSGVMDLHDVKRDEQNAAAKAEEASIKNLSSELKNPIYKIQTDWNRFHSDPNYRQELNEALNRKKGAIDFYDSTRQGYNLEKLTDESQQRSFFKNDAPKMLEGHRARFGIEMSTILNSGLSDDQQLTAMRGLITQMTDEMGGYFKEKGVASHPDTNKYQQDWKIYTDSTFEQISTAKTQSDKLKILENKEKIITTLSDLNIYDKADPATLRLLNLMPTPVIEKMFLNDTQAGQALIGNLTQLLSESLKNKAATREVFTSEGAGEPGITSGASLMMELNKNGQVGSLQKVLRAFSDSQNNRDLSESEHFNNIDDFYTISHRTDNLAQMKELDADSKVEMQSINTNYMMLLGKSLNALITDTGLFEPGKFRSDSFKVEELPNGGIEFVSDNPTFQTKLNREYATRYNKLVKVSSKLFNMSEKQVHDRYKANFDRAFSMGEVGSVGFPGTVSNNIDQKIISVERGAKFDSKNPKSTALGVGQFIGSTWLDVMSKHFPQRIEGLDKDQILELRKDPELSKQAVTAYRGDLQKNLKSNELPITDTTVYLSYFLGPKDGVKLLKSSPNTPIKNILSAKVIEANPNLQGNKTVRDVVSWATDKMEE